MGEKMGDTVRYGVSDWTFEFCDGSVEHITGVKKQSHTYNSGGEHIIEIESGYLHNEAVDKILDGSTECVAEESFSLICTENGNKSTRTMSYRCFIGSVRIVSREDKVSVCNLYISVKQE